MDMSSNSQLVKFYTLFVIFAEFDRLFIKLNFLHVTIKVGEGVGQPIGDLSLLFMSLFHGGGRAILDNVTKSTGFFLKSFLRENIFCETLKLKTFILSNVQLGPTSISLTIYKRTLLWQISLE